MLSLVWCTAIAYLILFIIVSTSIYFYTREKSFKYYVYYSTFLLIYLATKDLTVYAFLNKYVNHDVIIHFNWLIQVVFYSFYFIFALYFLDFEKFLPKMFKIVRLFLFSLIVLFFVFALLSIHYHLYNVFFKLFAYLFLPIVLLLFVYFFPLALKHSGKHKYFLLTGIVIYIITALTAFILSHYSHISIEPLKYFIAGIIIESICFSLGLAYKIKLINDESIKQKNDRLKAQHKLEITKLNALIEGEENERNRIAQDLHDGINGDLSAIKFQLMAFKNKLANDVNHDNLDKSIAMIDTTCEQVRTISHNLTPYAISQFGLSRALEQFCKKMHNSFLLIDYQWFGDDLVLPKSIETSIYRVVQELVQNTIKHANAKEVLVHCNNLDDNLNITVEDDGKGFDKNRGMKGIGFKNIENRINYLNAKMEIETSSMGTTILINISLKNIQL
ncbi:sensor histidine kinase [Flavobacterium jejuense]|uniref:histidine kinase n=1 Tax=Flavobacterium jejuense TaxID=1544455 RepID=A0ABX0ILA8_9FLAO|nr:sensor histidine kinase [Flavobacterium jejuense]NHN24503.1 sensor histidine kinase [Flavobacterium jejuense]